MWLGTQEGLNRYDGKSFLIIEAEPDNPAGLPSDWVLALLEDRRGDIWVATQHGGLARWRRETDTFVIYRHDPDDPGSLAENLVWALLEDDAGQLWVGTDHSGLDRLDPATGRFEHFRHDPDDPGSLADDRVRAVYQDREGEIWVATLGGGLDRLERESGTFEHLRHDPEDPTSLGDDEVRSIVQDQDGYLWVGTLDGLYRLDPAAGTFQRQILDPADPHSPGGNRIRVMMEDRDQRLWIGTDQGLYLRDRGKAGFVHYRHQAGDPTSLGADQLTAMWQDSGGVLWFGTQPGGVSKWDPRTWSFNTDPAGQSELGSPNVLAFAEEGRFLWVGTGSGLSRMDRVSGEGEHFRYDAKDPDSLSDDRVAALLRTRDGTLWVGTLAGGLDRFVPSRRGFDHFRHDPERPDSLASDRVICLYEDRQGAVWIGTLGGGLDRLDPARGTFSHFTHDPDDPHSLSDDRVSAITEGDGEMLWLGTFGGGLNRLDRRTGRVLRFRHDPEDQASLSNDNVLDLHREPDGTLWISTQVGLNRLAGIDPETGRGVFRRHLQPDGLPSDFVYGIERDDDGGLWLSTNRGLSRLDLATERFDNYDESHGLQSAEFNFGAHLRGGGGELFFGGISGYNVFYPDRIQRNTSVPPVVLTGFSKLNRPVELDRPIFDLDEIELSYEDRFFTFEFAALDYTSPSKNLYRYQLEGFSDAWIDLGNRGRVTFTNLNPGRYTLRVQGSNNDGVWNESGLAVAIVVPPPYWQTWWFRLLLLASATALVFLFIALRTRGIRRRNALLQAVVAERTSELEEAQAQLVRKERLAVLGELAGSVAHELRNPLGAIKNSAYFLRLTRALGEGKAQEHLGLIEREIDRSNGIITELLDFGRSPQPTFRRLRLGQVVEAALAAVALPDNVTLEKTPCDEVLEVKIDPDQIERILVNLVRNAAQAMRDGGRIEVDCASRDGKAVVTVADTGPGIPAEDLKRIFEPLFTGKAKGIGLGLPVSLRYATLNNGGIEVESREGEGATFRLVLPLAAGDETAANAAREALARG